MQLGKALLGGIIGAAVGTVLLIVLFLTLGLDKVWLSIPFAILTGIGVRMVANVSGNASYVRGALTMLLALAGYIGGCIIVAQVATARANATEKAPAVSGAADPGQADSENADDPDAKSTDEANKDAEPKAEAPTARSTEFTQPRVAMTRPVQYSPTDIICLAIAALIAYEFGRGSGVSMSGSQAPPAIPAGAHPDA